MGRAEAVTFDTYNLINSGGSGAGTVTIGTDGPPGIGTLTVGRGLDLLSFTFNGVGSAFTLSNAALVTPSVSFNNGILTNIVYVGTQNGFKLDLLSANLNYVFSDFVTPGLSSIGTISNTPATTPLPSSWTLMLIGLAGVAMMAFRRKNKAHIAAA